MQQEAIEVGMLAGSLTKSTLSAAHEFPAQEAMEKYKVEKEIAQEIKKEVRSPHADR